MKIYKTIKRSYDEKVLDIVRCELCKKETKNEWREDEWDATKVTIESKNGYCYPEGGSGNILSIDLCPDCFENKLVPWIRSQGGEVEEKDWDY